MGSMREGDIVRSIDSVVTRAGFVGEVRHISGDRPGRRKVKVRLASLPDGYDVSDLKLDMHTFEHKLEVVELDL